MRWQAETCIKNDSNGVAPPHLAHIERGIVLLAFILHLPCLGASAIHDARVAEFVRTHVQHRCAPKRCSAAPKARLGATAAAVPPWHRIT